MRDFFKILKEKTTRQKEEKRGNTVYTPEEHEGMPQHQHCPSVKRREEPKVPNHEEQQKDVTWILTDRNFDFVLFNDKSLRKSRRSRVKFIL
jgi:hypothetical protein